MRVPVDVFREVYRVPLPDPPFVVSFSNRCFSDQGSSDLAVAFRRPGFHAAASPSL
jgi:hypothetical protein